MICKFEQLEYASLCDFAMIFQQSFSQGTGRGLIVYGPLVVPPSFCRTLWETACCYGWNRHFPMGKLTINGHMFNSYMLNYGIYNLGEVPCYIQSIAMLNFQRVSPLICLPVAPPTSPINHNWTPGRDERQDAEQKGRANGPRPPLSNIFWSQQPSSLHLTWQKWCRNARCWADFFYPMPVAVARSFLHPKGIHPYIQSRKSIKIHGPSIHT